MADETGVKDFEENFQRKDASEKEIQGLKHFVSNTFFSAIRILHAELKK